MIITDEIHLTSTESLEELHKFAQSIGLKREWFQDHKKYPHYDLTTKRMSNKAIRYGATRLYRKRFLDACLKKEE